MSLLQELIAATKWKPGVGGNTWFDMERIGVFVMRCAEYNLLDSGEWEMRFDMIHPESGREIRIVSRARRHQVSNGYFH